MKRVKRLRGQALYEFLGTLPILLALFFLILAAAQVWNQSALAQRLSLEGARHLCAGAEYGSQTASTWSSAWPRSPVTNSSTCTDQGRCTYTVSSNYELTWSFPFLKPPAVNIRGTTSCPESKFYPGNQEYAP